MRVFGPDGREWVIARRPVSSGVTSLLPGGGWIVQATAGDEIRRWQAASRRAAGHLADEVALALRTGASGPAGELPDEHEQALGIEPMHRDVGSTTEDAEEGRSDT